MRDTTYDGWVHSSYPLYVDSPDLCERIIETEWESSSKVIARWVDICMAEVWKRTNKLRAICLYPLRLDDQNNLLSDMQPYDNGVLAKLDTMIDKDHTWHIIEAVDMEVIPVKVADTWALYLTQRSTKLRSVI